MPLLHGVAGVAWGVLTAAALVMAVLDVLSTLGAM